MKYLIDVVALISILAFAVSIYAVTSNDRGTYNIDGYIYPKCPDEEATNWGRYKQTP